MFNLRKEQLKIFDVVAAQDFEARVVALLRQGFAKECSNLDGPALAEITRYGIERAKSYGIVTEPDICKYVSVMLALGRDFDVNPRYPWAARTLSDEGLGDPSSRVNRLCAEALEAASQKGAAP